MKIKINSIKRRDKLVPPKPNKSALFKTFNRSLMNSGYSSFVKDLDFKNAGTKKYRLYEFIDEGLTFPEVFQKYNINGVVKAKLYFNRKGKFDLETSIFKAKNGFLRFHIMTYLERKLKHFNLGEGFNEGFVEASFVFKYTVSTLKSEKTFGKDQFIFERVGFKASTEISQALLEVGQTLISLLNLLKFRPDFLKSNSELTKEQQNLHYLQRIRQHRYFK